jgi:uncharacterized radical SAM superfamily Fe-S cluster-containing enzyme
MSPATPLHALCLDCSKVTDALYDVRDDGVFLVRNCPLCGTTDARITKDVEFFASIAAAALDADNGDAARGLIVELLDGCNIQCPTCIAESGPFAGNLRASNLLKFRIEQLLARKSFRAILLSGGEPTIHPSFFDLIGYTSALDVPGRVLITNGLRFARDPGFVEEFVRAGGSEMEVFLQWDSLRPEALRDIRGEDYSRERRDALDALARAGVTTTLVNVVKRGVTLEHLDEVLQVARDHHNVVGVQFQPIRDAGRVLGFSQEDNSCEVTDVFDHLPGGVRLTPCSNSPWSTFLGSMSRSTGEVVPADHEDHEDHEDDFYISPTNMTPPGLVRIAVLDYSDRFNWTSERSRLASLDVLDERGEATPVDDYFLQIRQTPASA